MFGELTFATTAFATWGTEVPEPYAQTWVNVCPAESDWDNEAISAIPTKECDNGS